MAASPVLVVGSLAYDDLEMPTGNFMNVTGGAATYCSLAIALFAPARLVGIVGDDFDQNMLSEMARRGIDTAGVETIAGGKTFRWKGRYAADLQTRTTLDTQLNVFADFKPKLPEAYKATPYVLLGNIHPALQLDVLGQVHGKPKLVAMDTMNFWIGGEPHLLGQVLAKIDLLVINDEEARELSGMHNLAKAAADIRRRGPSKLIIKRGEHGSYLFDDDGVFAAPTMLVDHVVDPTGAGDSFAGGLLGYLAAHDDGTPAALRRAMLAGAATGSFCVEGIGTERIARVSRAEVAARVSALEAMLAFGGSLNLRG